MKSLEDKIAFHISELTKLFEELKKQNKERDERARRNFKTMPVASMPIESLDLPVRAKNGLTNLGIQTVGQLVDMTKDDLSGIQNFGRDTLASVEAALATVGGSLKS